MRLAICLFDYFPYGGLQRDCLAIARALAQLGAQITVFTLSWSAEKPSDLTVRVCPLNVPYNALTAHLFSRYLSKLRHEEHFDAWVGFNKMPGLDYYYAADGCLRAKLAQLSVWRWLNPRTWLLLSAERAVFQPCKTTHVLSISPKATDDYRRWYGTPQERFTLLPPGIDRQRLHLHDPLAVRQQVRASLNIQPQQVMLLAVGSGFRTKGLDRSIRALAALPQEKQQQTHLVVVGQDNARPFLRLACVLGVQQRVQFLGGRDDVASLMRAADILLHPACFENTGTVLLEALVLGLPVVVTPVCGYAFHIERAGAGVVLENPFSQAQYNQVLETVLGCDATGWRDNALAYAAREDLYSLSSYAAHTLMSKVQKRRCSDGV